MALKAFNQSVVSLRSMPFWCVANPLGDPFGEVVVYVETRVRAESRAVFGLDTQSHTIARSR